MRVLSWRAHPPSGRPKGLPYPNQENLWKTCKARAGDREGRPYRAARTYARPGNPGRPSVPRLRKSGNVSGYAAPLSRT